MQKEFLFEQREDPSDVDCELCQNRITLAHVFELKDVNLLMTDMIKLEQFIEVMLR